jgi:hypothetical protein
MKTEHLLLPVLAALCVACGSKRTSGDAESDGDGPPTVLEWDEEDLPYRATVTLNPHPGRDRLDVPVIAPITHPGSFVRRGVSIHEVTASGTDPTAGSAWSQPDGRHLEVGFTAEGTTAQDAVRTFLVYYDVSDAPEDWARSDGLPATFEMLDRDDDSTDDGYRFSGPTYTLEREIGESDGTLRSWRRDGGDTRLEHEGWYVAEGFSTSYQLESLTETFSVRNPESEPADGFVLDREERSAALGASWTGLADPIAHDAHVVHRLFGEWPFMQMVLSVAPSSSPELYGFSSANYSGRSVYLVDAYDRMVSDTRGDEALARTWDTSMRWLVVYDSSTDRGFGWFIFDRGLVRADDEEGEYSIFDSYGGSSGGRLAFRSLWMASSSKDEIADLFDAMKPGVTVSDPEHRDLNIVHPRDGDHFFPEDTLEVVVSTPGSREHPTATLSLPDGSEIDVELDSPDSPLLWRSVEPLDLTASHPVGSWVVTAEGSGRTEQVTFEFRLPNHPKLMFGPEDLDDIRSRKDDARYEAIWDEMLRLASRYDPPISDPGPGRDIRGYADRLMNLALVQLVDPAQPHEDLMWEYAFTMLRYPNWDPDSTPFNNHDLTVGHFLTALALTYDWHYDSLTPGERAEFRAHLRQVAGYWLTTGYMRIYRDITWNRYGTVTNNHYWINHQGVAAAAFVLADEMPEEERSRWVDHLEENLSIILSVLEDDGTSNEGVAYHAYGQINLFRWLDFRDRALSENTAEAIPWFAESVLWDLYSIMPGGDDNYGGPANFGDCPTRHYQPPRTIQAWLARRLGSGHAQWVAEELDWPYVTAMSYLWYDPSVPASAPDALPTWRLFPLKGIFTWRSSWADDATYLSLKSGSYFGGHEQPDAGHFILSRAGVPYITDHGYSYLKMTDEHNLVTIDGVGQHGEGNQWMSAVDPVSWASVTFVLADRDYFDMIADPTPMYISEDLDAWTREVVGLGPDIFLVRDGIGASAPVEVDWLLHGYVSEPPSSAGGTYAYAEHRTESPWTEDSTALWSLRPQSAAPALHVADASHASWSATLEPSFYVPELNPDTREYNETYESFQVGARLRRTITSDAAPSLVALWFGDAIAVESWSGAQADALKLHDSSTDVAVAIWPSEPLTGFHGWDVTGEMAGRRLDEPAYFGRSVTHVADAGVTLLDAASAVSLFARLEHTGADPRFAIVRADASTDVTLHCPVEPARVLLDGSDAAFTWAAQSLSLTVPAGEHRIVLE